MTLICPRCAADLHEEQIALGPKADIRRCPVCQVRLQPRVNGAPFLFAWAALAIPSLAVLYLLTNWGPTYDEVIGRWLDDSDGAAAGCVAVISLVMAAVWTKKRDRHPSLALQTAPGWQFWAGLALVVVPVAVALYVAVTGDPSAQGVVARLAAYFQSEKVLGLVVVLLGAGLVVIRSKWLKGQLPPDTPLPLPVRTGKPLPRRP